MPSAASPPFDIHTRYLHHLSTLPPILASISALTDSIESHPVQTVSETLSLLSSSSSALHNTTDLPTITTPGVAAFRRWLVLLLEHHTSAHGSPRSGPVDKQDFEGRKRWIVDASREYVIRGAKAKEELAETCVPLLKGTYIPHIVVHVCDEAISATLCAFAKTHRKMRVSLVQPLYLGSDSEAPGLLSLRNSHNSLVKQLEPYGITVDEIPPQGVATAITMQGTIVLAASSLVFGNGAVLAPLGTRQVAVVARAAKVPCYIMGESYKLVGSFPLDYGERPGDGGAKASMDLTPPELVTGFVTEKGIISPTQVSDLFIKKWF